MLKIAIVGPKISMSLIKKVIENNEFKCEFYIYTYNQLEEIQDIYLECRGKVDGIFFSGERGYLYAYNNINSLSVPCKFIAYDTVHVLSILLDFVIEHPDIPLNRVFVDFLIPFNNYCGINEFIKKEYMPICNTAGVFKDDLISNIKALWDNDKIDIVLIRSTGNIKNMENVEIPFIHILPTEEIIIKAIGNALTEIKYHRISNLPKIICIIKPYYKIESTLDENEYIEVTMYKALIDIKKEINKNIKISNITGRFELIFYNDEDELNIEIIRYILNSLIKYKDFNFNLGLGISLNYDNSKYLAEKALRESISYGLNDGFAAYENDTILGPLSQADTLIYNIDKSNIIRFAKENSIDTGNMYRIIGLYNKNKNAEINSEILSKWLNITPRSCNRIIKQLLKLDLIKSTRIIETKGKGRPINNYKFVSTCMDNIFDD